MKKKISFHPCFRNLIVEPIKKEAKESSFLVTEEEPTEKFTKCLVKDHARDCSVFKSIDTSRSQDRYVLVQTHMIDVLEVDGEIIHLVPEHAVV
ncbi:MAG: hypothetical protein Q8P81_00880, partial [Nanoarchaeota archaeon]|nr:hypothetical protein [Nanoarchaeota archaeon]